MTEVGDDFFFLLSELHLILHYTDRHCGTEGSLPPSEHGAHSNAAKYNQGMLKSYPPKDFWDLYANSEGSAR